jgi:hypothetical protein
VAAGLEDSSQAALELAIILPPDGTSEPLIGLPLSLPMGCKASPPFFCTFMETCADLTNDLTAPSGPHPFQYALEQQPEHAHILPPAPTTIRPYKPTPPADPLQYTDMYLDDFMVIAQQPAHIPTMNRLLYHLSSIFQDPGHSPRQPVVSTSKVLKGDTTFSTSKCILGWDVHTDDMTLRLPPHRMERLSQLIHTYLLRRYTTRHQWQQLLGELWSMMLTLHSS